MGRTRVRRARAALAALVLLALVVGFLAGRAAAGGAPPAVAPRSPGQVSPASARPRFHVVRPGDTLWSIASRLAGPGADPRPVVDRLARLNRVAGGVIVPGQRLILP